MSKHAPIIRLQNAKDAYYRAQELCPHWDFESDGDGHDCCHQMSDAAQEVRLARRAYREDES